MIRSSIVGARRTAASGMRPALLAFLRSIACILSMALLPTPAKAADAYFKDRQIRLIVGSAPGGGYDAYGRLLAQYMKQHIPGNPNVIVQNMPGAGSLVAANYIYNVAPKDGTTFGLIARNMPLIGLIGNNSNVRFDPHRFTWLGSSSNFSNDAYVLIVRKDAP